MLSYDGENEPETIAGVGASAALLISDIPFETPIATVRVGRVGGQYVINPKHSDLDTSDISILVSGSRDAIMMVEGEADDVPEDEFLDAIFFGFKELQKIIDIQEELRKKVGKAKRSWTPRASGDVAGVQNLVSEKAKPLLVEAYKNRIKAERYTAIDAAFETVLKTATENLKPTDATLEAFKASVQKHFDKAKKEYARELTLTSGRRIDGREYAQIRPIQVEAGVLPRVHGSALFTRGETQALAVVTLGTGEDEQLIDSVRGKYNKRFLLHYNFPPFCVGETGRLGFTSRREVGHAALAERAVSHIVPKDETTFPYVIRVVSEVLESNGSSSMATVCASSMALMDAGVPVSGPVAGIAMGLMVKDGKVVILSDILGDEDACGDMDFKVCGTPKGVTACQMDIKIKGVTREIMSQALNQARDGRIHILNEMNAVISEKRPEVSVFAPRFVTIQISQERIKDLIGPGGKNIKSIVAATGVKIDIDDNGIVRIASTEVLATEKAIQMVKDLTEDAEIGKVYMGTVKRIADFGAFIEIMPGTDGLCHISELDHNRVNSVRDILEEGDQVPVKVLEIDRQGKIRLSRKAALPETQA
jgi:polyribonucleotide nucleotidyltransferase